MSTILFLVHASVDTLPGCRQESCRVDRHATRDCGYPKLDMIRTRHIAMHLIFVLVHTHNSVRMFTCFRTSCVWPYIMDSRTSLIFNMRRESYESSSCVQSSHRHAWIGAASQMTRGTGAYRSRSARAGSSHTEFAFCHHHGRPGQCSSSQRQVRFAADAKQYGDMILKLAYQYYTSRTGAMCRRCDQRERDLLPDAGARLAI